MINFLTGLIGNHGPLHFLKNLYQRYKNGAGCCDLWSADNYMAGKILPVLKAFRNQNNGEGPDFHPAYLSGLEEWNKILDEMIWGFERFQAGESPEEALDPDNMKLYEKMEKRESKAFKLFGEYFRYIWS